MLENYVDKLKELGFQLNSPIEAKGFIKSREGGYIIGVYNEEESIPITIAISPEDGEDLLSERIDAIQILKNNEIPYKTSPSIDEAVKEIEKEIATKSKLIQKLKELEQ